MYSFKQSLNLSHFVEKSVMRSLFLLTSIGGRIEDFFNIVLKSFFKAIFDIFLFLVSITIELLP